MSRTIAGFGVAMLSLAAICSRAPAAQPANVEPTVDQPLPRPGMGWSTYNFFLGRHNDALMRQMADAFVASGLRDAGYTILRIDGGWWGEDSDRRWYYWTQSGKYLGGLEYHPGDPHVEEKNYPGGIRPLADYMHSKGMKLGFYLSPELSTGTSDNYPHNNRDHKIPTPVTGLALVDQHAKWVADNGIDHLFFDGYDWNESKGKEPYVRMFQQLRMQAKRVNRPIIFSINSGWKARPRDWADEWRTSPDINEKWPSIMENLATVADPRPAGKGRWNNPDYLMVGFTGDEEAKSQMSLWCVAGAPLYLSYDFRAMNEWERYVALNTEAIAVDQDSFGVPGWRVRADAESQVWERPLAGGSMAVVLLNTSGAARTITVKWPDLGLNPHPGAVRDLWAHKFIDASPDGYTSKNLPPHGCAFIRAFPIAQPPIEPKRTWAPYPAPRTHFVPLPSAGWKLSTNLPRKDDPLTNMLDGNPATEFWSYASPGQYIELNFGKPLTFDRVVMDHRGTGANPWPYKVYSPGSTFALQASADGGAFHEIAHGAFGPACTIVSPGRITARRLRIVVTKMQRTSAFDNATLHIKDLYFIDARETQASPRAASAPR